MPQNPETVEINNKIESSEECQWAQSGNAFKLVGKTVKKLEPGFFKITQDMAGDPTLRHQSIEVEGLMKLDEGNTSEIIQDICNFWEQEELYNQFSGVPFKRGIMMSGPPGTGKTCIIKLVLADIISRGGVCLEMHPQETGVFIAAYNDIRKIQPKVPVLAIIEDFNHRMVNMSFLNMMDGLVPLHKVVFLATTNYPKELPDTILNRPGRFDAHYEIPFPSPSAREALLKTIIPSSFLPKIDLAKYVKDSYGFSMGHLKELVVSTMLMGKDYSMTVARLKGMREGIKENEQEDDLLISGGLEPGPITIINCK